MKRFLFSALAFLLCYNSFGQISGPVEFCEGTSVTYTDAAGGGLWSSSNTAVVDIGSTTGVATGLSAGVAIISYVGTTTDIYSVTVDPAPAPITGPSSVCEFATVTLTTGSGGTLTSGTPGIVIIDTLTGDVTGASTGSTTLSYTLYSTGCMTTLPFIVNPLPTAYSLTGGGSYCTATGGVPVGLAGSDLGVIYQLYVGGAPLGSPVVGTGSAISFGTQTVAGTYSVNAIDASTGCSTPMAGSVTVSVITSPTSYTVAGGGGYCAGTSGTTISLSGSDSGINYELDSAGVAVGSLITGTGGPLTFGPITGPGTYTIVADPTATCALTMSGSATISINPLPGVYAIAGGGSYCAGSSGVVISLTNSDAGVSYQLMLGASPVGATVPGTGGVISFALQTAAGTYTAVGVDATTSCTSNMSGSASISIDPVPAVYFVTGGGIYCTGGAAVNVTLTGSQTGINYQAYNGASAAGSPVAGTGLTLSLGGMTTAGAYTVTGTDAVTGCISNMTGSVTITASTATVAASASVACGGLNTLTASGSVSYTWAPATGLSCTACATATVLPTTSVTYTVTGTNALGCTARATAIANGNNIYGAITYTGGSVTDLFRVWLIQFNPSDSSIIATDSMTTCMVSSAVAPFYQFANPAPGNYMVKAELLGTTPGTSGYIPTYSSSTPYWYSAASVSHSSGSNAMPITMIYGTVPTGPGFISGYVYAGAGKGTSGDAPDPGIMVYLRNSSTGNVLTYTRTDAAGHYSFGSLDYASYNVYPEDFDYHTTPSDVIRISPSSASVSNINFRRSTTFGTITPKPAALQNIPESNYYIAPNPTSGDISVTWPVIPGSASVNVTDLTGRTVYNEVFNAASGKANISLGSLQNGIYFIAVTTDNYNFGTKLLIQK